MRTSALVLALAAYTPIAYNTPVARNTPVTASTPVAEAATPGQAGPVPSVPITPSAAAIDLEGLDCNGSGSNGARTVLLVLYTVIDTREYTGSLTAPKAKELRLQLTALRKRYGLRQTDKPAKLDAQRCQSLKAELHGFLAGF